MKTVGHTEPLVFVEKSFDFLIGNFFIQRLKQSIKTNNLYVFLERR